MTQHPNSYVLNCCAHLDALSHWESANKDKRGHGSEWSLSSQTVRFKPLRRETEKIGGIKNTFNKKINISIWTIGAETAASDSTWKRVDFVKVKEGKNHPEWSECELQRRCVGSLPTSTTSLQKQGKKSWTFWSRWVEGRLFQSWSIFSLNQGLQRLEYRGYDSAGVIFTKYLAKLESWQISNFSHPFILQRKNFFIRLVVMMMMFCLYQVGVDGAFKDDGITLIKSTGKVALLQSKV